MSYFLILGLGCVAIIAVLVIVFFIISKMTGIKPRCIR